MTFPPVPGLWANRPKTTCHTQREEWSMTTGATLLIPPQFQKLHWFTSFHLSSVLFLFESCFKLLYISTALQQILFKAGKIGCVCLLCTCCTLSSKQNTEINRTLPLSSRAHWGVELIRKPQCQSIVAVQVLWEHRSLWWAKVNRDQDTFLHQSSTEKTKSTKSVFKVRYLMLGIGYTGQRGC